MRILIIEDEASVADRIERLTRQVLGTNIQRLAKRQTLSAGLHYLQNHPIDLLLLDLNLNGLNGFSILQELLSHSFQTIIVSANTDQALKAFEYGVLDFIPKPFTIERLTKAFDRYTQQTNQQQLSTSQYLSVRRKGEVHLIPIKDIQFIKASGNYSEIHLIDQQKHLHDKNLNSLELLLPNTFRRIHRSYICNWEQMRKILTHGAGKYEVELQSGQRLPLSRSKYQQLK
ncbi:MAG: response regulator transcription factor [Bacteroidota bacterium]